MEHPHPCEPVAAETLAWFEDLHGPSGRTPVQVKVGEGNQRGSTWWIVVYNSYELVTDSPGREGRGEWFDVTQGWHTVTWEGGRLKRGKAALEKALACYKG